MRSHLQDKTNIAVCRLLAVADGKMLTLQGTLYILFFRHRRHVLVPTKPSALLPVLRKMLPLLRERKKILFTFTSYGGWWKLFSTRVNSFPCSATRCMRKTKQRNIVMLKSTRFFYLVLGDQIKKKQLETRRVCIFLTRFEKSCFAAVVFRNSLPENKFHKISLSSNIREQNSEPTLK